MKAFAARQEIRKGQLIALEIDNPLLTSVEVSLVVRRDKIFSPVLKQLIGLLKNKLLIFTHNEQAFRQDGIRAWEEYQATGLHAMAEEVDAGWPS